MSSDTLKVFTVLSDGTDRYKAVTPRIEHMRNLIRNRVIRIDSERVEIVTASYKKTKNMPPAIRRAQATYDIAANMTCRVEDFEVIFGNIGQNFLGTGFWPENDGYEWLFNEIDVQKTWTFDEETRLWTKQGAGEQQIVSEETLQVFRDARDFWKDECITAKVNTYQPEWAEEIVYQCGAVMMGPPFAGVCTEGHLIAGYKKILEVGYAAIRKQAQDWLDDHVGFLMGDDPQKYLFYKSATLACDAATTMIQRYSKACSEKAAATEDPVRKAELEKMADSLMWISENPARTFWEAVQGTIMYHLLIILEARHPALGLGRIDQMWWPYLEKELKAETITMDQAQEIVDAFLLKLNCFYSSGPSYMSVVGGVGVTYQHVTIGGVDPDTGEDATNPITYMVLQTMGRLLLHDPATSLRIHKNTPRELWDAAFDMTQRVGGLPLFQNDDVLIDTLVKYGYERRDAMDYGFIGCQEAVGSGNDFPSCNHHNVYASITLTVALNNGVNPKTGKGGGLKTGYLYEMETFEEVKEAYYKQLKFQQDGLVSILNWAEMLNMWYRPEAVLSIGIEGCMENGVDCTKGGAKYNSYGGSNHGFATVADSLTTIRYMCFDKKLCTTRELYDAIMADWVGYEDLRQVIINDVPHYGNDDPYADEQMAWVINSYFEILGQYYSTRSPFFRPGLYGAAAHVAEGELCAATPDGRKGGTPVADATSPVQGRDMHGPTGVFNSTLCFDHHNLPNGMALNLKIHPSAIQGSDGASKLIDMVRSYFDRGGLEVQFNIIGTDIMKEAQKKPEEYHDLVVRIAGFSAYFVELTKGQQNDVISRYEHSF